MELERKIEYWLDIAQYDLDTAHSMQEKGRYLYTVYMCQQSIEKILKTIHIQKVGKEAPYSHNLVYLQSLVDLSPDESDLTLMAELTAYYIEGRYPTYKQKPSLLVDRTKAQKILEKTMKAFQWLKSQVK